MAADNAIKEQRKAHHKVVREELRKEKVAKEERRRDKAAKEERARTSRKERRKEQEAKEKRATTSGEDRPKPSVSHLSFPDHHAIKVQAPLPRLNPTPITSPSPNESNELPHPNQLSVC